MSLWLIYASGAIPSSQQHSPGKLTLVHKGNMCESARSLLCCLILAFLFYQAWTLQGQFFCKQLCIKTGREIQNRVVRGVRQLQRDGGSDRWSSLKIYKSWTHRAARPLKQVKEYVNSLCAIKHIFVPHWLKSLLYFINGLHIYLMLCFSSAAFM